MAGDDRNAVLETVRRFFTNAYWPPDECFAGPLLEWQTLVRQLLVTAPYKVIAELESAVILGLAGTRAVVHVRAGLLITAGTGETGVVERLDGPATLEQRDGRWLLVDYTSAGRSLLEQILLAPLDQQELRGVTARVLGIERTERGTGYIVELVNASTLEARLTRVDERHEGSRRWRRLLFAPRAPVPPGATALVQIVATTPLEPSALSVSLALTVLDGLRERPFRLAVPLGRPDPGPSAPAVLP